jgi:uroporphyrin-III C-methyltransferase
MAPALLTAIDSSSHVHLIIGSNPLAGARCARSIEVGAIPKLIAAESAELHFGLAKRVEAGEIQWIKSEFQDEHLSSLGRDEVDNVVDAVFVTLGGRHPLSTS